MSATTKSGKREAEKLSTDELEVIKSQVLYIANIVAKRHFSSTIADVVTNAYVSKDTKPEPLNPLYNDENADIDEARHKVLMSTDHVYRQKYQNEQKARELQPDKLVYKKQIRGAKDILAAKLPDVMCAALKLALGTQAVRYDKNGVEVGVYTTLPDIKAIQFVAERVMGKPIEFIEETSTQTVNNNVQIYIPDNNRSSLAADVEEFREQTRQALLSQLLDNSTANRQQTIDTEFVPEDTKELGAQDNDIEG